MKHNNRKSVRLNKKEPDPILGRLLATEMVDPLDASCPPAETVAAYIEGRLPREEHANVTEHLGFCSDCYTVFAEVAKDESQRRRRNIYRILAAAAVVALVLFASRIAVEQRAPESVEKSSAQPDYWIHKHGLLPEQNPFAGRAKRVFQRLLPVMEMNKSGPVHLVLLGNAGAPQALSLRDGSILLTEDALQLCYRQVPAEQGDARMAFVIGHELVHQKNHRFVHLAAFSAVEEETALPGVSREEELDADVNGLVYAALAGFDPRSVIQPETSFIQDWVSQLPEKLAYEDREHPGPEKRAEFLRVHLRKVVRDLDYFYFGTRLYQLGRYEDASLLLRHFAGIFPGREVWNNLGLTHYQMAMQRLSTCDPDAVQRVYLATLLDPQTRAAKFRTPSTTPCLQQEGFLQEIQKAQDSFKKATAMDPSYLPARINLSSLQIVMGQYTQALEVLDQALKLKSGDFAAMNNKAVALYLSNPSEISLPLSILEDVTNSNSAYAPAFYNKALMESDSHESLRRFLQLEPDGLLAMAARKKLNLKESAQAKSEIDSPVTLGPMTASVRQMLEKMEKQSFSTSELQGAFYNDSDRKLLVIDDGIEILETDPPEGLTLQALQKPKRTIMTPAGSVQVHDNFAIEIQEGRVHRILYFE